MFNGLSSTVGRKTSSVATILRNCIFGSRNICVSQILKNHDAGKLKEVLASKFPKASSIEVEDISGGCGAMYEVWVESVEFEGLSRIKQHKLITQALKNEIKDMHGIRISTTVPEES